VGSTMTHLQRPSRLILKKTYDIILDCESCRHIETKGASSFDHFKENLRLNYEKGNFTKRSSTDRRQIKEAIGNRPSVRARINYAKLCCLTHFSLSKAAASSFEYLEKKKEVTRVNKDRTCAPRKHHISSCLDSNFQSKILGKPWQNFARSHISEEQPKSAKPQGKQTTQAVVATTPKTDSNATNKPHDGKYTSPKAGDHSPGSTKIEIRPTVNSNSATVNSNSATVYIKYFQKRAKKVQKSVAQSCDLAGIRTRVTSFEDYRYTAGTLNQTPMQRKGEMPDSMIQNNSIYNHGKADTIALLDFQSCSNPVLKGFWVPIAFQNMITSSHHAFNSLQSCTVNLAQLHHDLSITFTELENRCDCNLIKKLQTAKNSLPDIPVRDYTTSTTVYTSTMYQHPVTKSQNHSLSSRHFPLLDQIVRWRKPDWADG